MYENEALYWMYFVFVDETKEKGGESWNWFCDWMIKNNYCIPKSQKEAEYRIKQYLKFNHFIPRRKWWLEKEEKSSIRNIDSIDSIIKNTI